MVFICCSNTEYFQAEYTCLVATITSMCTNQYFHEFCETKSTGKITQVDLNPQTLDYKSRSLTSKHTK